MVQKHRYWLAFGIAFFASLLVLWINLAVGIIGEPDDPANLMYIAVLAIGCVGAIVARFRPRGMVRVSIVMVLCQVCVGFITLTTGLGYPPTPPLTYMILNLILIAFWSCSGLLFKQVAEA